MGRGFFGNAIKNNPNWCDCRNLPTFNVDGKKVVCVPPSERKLKCTGKNVCIRPCPILPKNQLHTSDARLQDDTTYKIDYPAKHPCPPRMILPHSRTVKGVGAMPSDTTYKIDYPAKPRSKREPIFPYNEMTKSTKPMQGVTTTMSAYKVPEGFIPSTSFRPDYSCRPPLAPMEDETTQKAHYVAWNCRGPVGPYPWTPGNKYTHPSVPMYGDTTYKKSYLPQPGEGRLPPYEPKRRTSFYEKTHPADYLTTYKDDYPGNAGYCRREEIRRKDNMQPSTKKFQDKTTHKDDFPGRCGDPAKPIFPISRRHIGEGPMSSDTTQKLDFQAKPYSKREPIVCSNEMTRSTKPMQGITTTMSAYKVPEGFVPSTSFRPDYSCRPPLAPMEDETTQKAHYVAWNCRGPVGPYPWTPGNKYTHPSVPMFGDTTYKKSYDQPGYHGRTVPIVPRGQGIGIDSAAFDDSTTYKNDYLTWEMVNEKDCYGINSYNVGDEPPCDLEQQQCCYKVDGVCPFYPPSKKENPDIENDNIPVSANNNIPNASFCNHNIPIPCC